MVDISKIKKEDLKELEKEGYQFILVTHINNLKCFYLIESVVILNENNYEWVCQKIEERYPHFGANGVIGEVGLYTFKDGESIKMTNSYRVNMEGDLYLDTNTYPLTNSYGQDSSNRESKER